MHAELRLGDRITVGHNAVAMLMRRAGLAGLCGNRAPRRRTRPVDTPVDLVDRNFVRVEPDQLWLTDITEHPTREGRVYCAVVLDVFSRRVVGWSIDNTATSSLVTSALGMAIDNRKPPPGDCDTFRPGHPVRVLGVHPTSPPIRARSVDGNRRRLF